MKNLNIYIELLNIINKIKTNYLEKNILYTLFLVFVILINYILINRFFYYFK